MKLQSLHKTLARYYGDKSRSMPWRDNHDPYYVLVSELMLQQTQVERVIPKFTAFITTFPDITSLARASFSDVLREWTGLGYNRRAKFLQEAAQAIVNTHNSQVPRTREALITLPGIGPNTAGAILVYAYNQAEVFVETNVRTVFIHHFFSGESKVTDAQIATKVRGHIDTENPKTWYWAVMDYGTELKKSGSRVARTSASYRKQSRFEGSQRQLRVVLKRLLANPATITDLENEFEDPRLENVVNELMSESMIAQKGSAFVVDS